MPGYGANQLQYKIQSGNTCVLLVGSQPIAFAQTTTHRFPFGTEAFYGIGSAKPQEIQQLRIGPEISLNSFALTAFGNTLLAGGVSLFSILANNQFNISVADNNGNTLFTYVGCVATDPSEEIGANRPVTDSVSFLALDVLDNTGQSILNGPSAFNIAGSLGVEVNGGLGIGINT